jgi:hypothetical protein
MGGSKPLAEFKGAPATIEWDAAALRSINTPEDL